MKKKVLAMVLAMTMVLSLAAIAHANDHPISDAGIAFWIEDDNGGGNNNDDGGPEWVNPGRPGTTPGGPPGGGPGEVDPDHPWAPPTDDDDVIADITAMDCNDLDFHLHNHVLVMERTDRVTFQSVELAVPETADGVPNRNIGVSRLGILLYNETARNWGLQVRMSEFTYRNAAEQNITAMQGYTLVLTQNGINLAADARTTAMTSTTWLDNIALDHGIGTVNVVAADQGGRGIHGQEFAGALTFVGDTIPSIAVRAQAQMHWTRLPDTGTRTGDGVEPTSGAIDASTDISAWD